MSRARKPGRQPVDRRAEILDAAERLYDVLGFEKTTVTDIADELGMSPANLYRHFPNRQAIDEAIARRKLAPIEDAAWAAARKAPQDPIAAFHEMVHAVMQATLRIFVAEERHYRLCVIASEARWPVVDRFMHDLKGAVRHLILEGRDAGVFVVEDADRTASAVFWSLLRVWHPQMLALYRDQALEETAEDLCALNLRALMK